MQCGNNYGSLPAYVAKTLYPTTTEADYARFAFYAVEGKDDAYQIYCYDADKWLTYTAGSSFSTGKDMITLSSSQVSNTYFKVTQLTSGSYAGTYEIQPYTTSGTTTGFYFNYHGGVGANCNQGGAGYHTIGLWTDNGNTDTGSHWTFHDICPKAVINNTTMPGGSSTTIVENEKQTKNTAWCKETDIDWNTQKLLIIADLNGVRTADAAHNKCIFSVSTSRDNVGWVDNSCNSIWYNYSTTEVQGYVLTGDKANSGYKAYGTNPVTFEYTKEHGLRVNETVYNHTAAQLEKILSASHLYIGAGSDAASATITIKVQSLDYVTEESTSQSNILKEDKKNVFSAQENVKVALSRTISSSYWNTFCVPFAVSADMVNAVFGSNCEIREYDNMDGTTMNFKSASSIEAGKPYLIKPASDVVNPTFSGVSIVAGDPVAVGSTYQMKGTYGLTDLATDGTNLFLGDQDKFYIPSVSGKTMKGMRAYFIVPSGTSATALRANIDGNVTAISHINGAEVVGAAPVYNLQGQYVGTSLGGLPRGIYVQNGKKVVVR